MSLIRDVVDITLRVCGTTSAPHEIERLEREVLSGLQQRSYGGLKVTTYVPHVTAWQRSERARSIRAAWNGANARELAARFRISEDMVRRIAGRRKLGG